MRHASQRFSSLFFFCFVMALGLGGCSSDESSTPAVDCPARDDVGTKVPGQACASDGDCRCNSFCNVETGACKAFEGEFAGCGCPDPEDVMGGGNMGGGMSGGGNMGGDGTGATPIPGASCGENGFNKVSSTATNEQFGVRYLAVDSEQPPGNMLRIEIFTDFNGPTEPGTYDLAEQGNFADCGLCVRIMKNATGIDEFEKQMYAEEGTVEITQIDSQRFSARIINAVFKEVTIDRNFRSQEVEGGESWCLNGYELDATIGTGGGNSGGGGGGPTSGFGVEIGQTVNDFSLMRCSDGQMFSMREHFGEDNTKAAFIMLTAGWCGACSSAVPQVIGLQNMQRANGFRAMFVVGEDPNRNPATQSYCSRYAQQYGGDPADFFIDNDGTNSFRTVFAAMNPYLGEGGRFGLPWKAVVDPSNWEYKYADGSPADYEAVMQQLMQ